MVDAAGMVRLVNQAAVKLLGNPPRTRSESVLQWIGWPGHQTTDSDTVTDKHDRVLERFTTGVAGFGQIYVLRDVTDRVQSDAARRRLEQVIATMKQGFSISSVSTGRILATNLAFNEMHGYPPGELDGAPLEKIFAGNCEEQTDVAAAIRENTLQRRSWEGETMNLRKDGSTFPARARVNLYEENDDQLLSSIVADITDEKRMEYDARLFQAKLLHNQKLQSLGVLAGGIAHDFNNLLTGILGNASLALDTLPGWSPLRERLKDISQASERAADLTRQLLAYAGKGRFLIQPINLSKLIDEVTQLVRISIPRTVSLRLKLREVSMVEADAGQMQQLLMNLIINGAEAIGDDTGTLSIATGTYELNADEIAGMVGNKDLKPGEYVYCEIADTGCGMDKTVLSRIFDPFFTTKFTGRGLGLAASLGIVNGHQGGLCVSSEVGKGTTFRIYLPSWKAPEGAAVEIVAPAVSSLGGRGTILVVDDDDMVRTAARNVLEHFGYHVLPAENGQQAIEIFEAHADQISLVLLDLTMPVMSGEDTLHGLRSINEEVRVILSSGFNESEAVRRFAGMSLAGFIQKPYTSARLAEKVKSAVFEPENSTPE